VKIKILGTDQIVEIPDEPHAPETEEQVFENLVRHRQRAAAMSPESRRQAIIAATVPLLTEHGAQVTTSRIARAAGIAEGTIFRVFPEKRELVIAAFRSATSGKEEVARIREIPPTLPLAERLVAALQAIEEFQRRFWALMHVYHETVWIRERDEVKPAPGEHPMVAIRGAIQELIEPDAASLRVAPHTAAGLLLSLSFGRCTGEQGMGEPSVTAEQLVDLFLQGALQARSGEASR
jgi:AcrR family transcriptional regulator